MSWPDSELKTLTELGVSLSGAHNISDLIGAVWGLRGLLILEADLSPEFLNLSTGLLGDLFQKLVNYGVQTALVIPNPAAYGERFRELAHEHTTHPQIRIFNSESEARAWLAVL